jgi:hypothetical protein
MTERRDNNKRDQQIGRTGRQRSELTPLQQLDREKIRTRRTVSQLDVDKAPLAEEA